MMMTLEKSSNFISTHSFRYRKKKKIVVHCIQETTVSSVIHQKRLIHHLAIRRC